VTGYQGGEMNLDGDYMIVRQSDAHAWAEALLDGQWQRFDPTAAVAPSRIERGWAPRCLRASRYRISPGWK
jgi:transglutaminase-like putative cysteine protease